MHANMENMNRFDYEKLNSIKYNGVCPNKEEISINRKTYKLSRTNICDRTRKRRKFKRDSLYRDNSEYATTKSYLKLIRDTIVEPMYKYKILEYSIVNKKNCWTHYFQTVEELAFMLEISKRTVFNVLKRGGDFGKGKFEDWAGRIRIERCEVPLEPKQIT